jgi:hypothetical protein
MNQARLKGELISEFSPANIDFCEMETINKNELKT